MLFARPDFDQVLARLVRGELLPGSITGHVVRDAVAARFGEFPADLHPALVTALRARGIEKPYVHQASAIAHARAGRNVVLTTPTASGKTLCFNVPVLDRILREPSKRALYLFPTKALSADQYAGLHQLISAAEGEMREVKTYTFDGDTPADARRAVRDHGQIVITNPDMLHAALLPQHTKWTKLFENLGTIVIDELHSYRGIFGSHVAHLLRRLLRVCRFHGSAPNIIACSATIANPLALAEGLCGESFELVGESGGPEGEHHFVAYNPPVVNAQLQIRAGAMQGAVDAAKALLLAKVPTIVFAGSRLHVELILKYLREALVAAQMDPELVQGYRGGYLPHHRRRIEEGLRAGTVRGVVATNALEMGVDIGTLQASVIAGYPGSIASFRQQSGRAGRRSGKALTVFVAGSGALDQYLATDPARLFGGVPEVARINPRNVFVLVDHAKCAAFELPFEPGDRFGVLEAGETAEVLEYLASHRVLHASPSPDGGARYHWMDRVFPANHVSLRGGSEENFIVIDLVTDNVLAEVDFRSAHTSLHEHAIYHVDSRHFQVERLDYDDHKAFVRRVEPDYYTTAMTNTRVAVLQEDGTSTMPTAFHADITRSHGDVLVTRKFVGFKKVRFHTHEVIGYGDIHLPDLEVHTSGVWFDVPRAVLDGMPFERDVLIDALSGVAHALKTVACAALMCAERDLGHAVGERQDGGQDGGSEAAPAADPKRSSTVRAFDPTVFLYDSVPGGIGLAPEIHQRFDELLGRAGELLGGCVCADGCPACLGPMPSYGGAFRRAARALVGVLAGQGERQVKAAPKAVMHGAHA